MENLWNEQAAGNPDLNSELDRCTHAAYLIGSQKSLVIYPWGSVSVKIKAHNLFSEEEDILYISAKGADLATLDADGYHPSDGIRGYTSLHCKHLADLARLDSLSDAQLENALWLNRIEASSPFPPLEAPVHAMLPYRYVSFTCPEALLAIASSPDGAARLRQIYGDSLLILEYARSGFPLVKACTAAVNRLGDRQIEGIYILGQGLWTFGNDARSTYERTIRLVSVAEQYLQEHHAWDLHPDSASPPPRPPTRELPVLRKAISDAAGFPVILSHHDDALAPSLSRRSDVAEITGAGPAVPAHAAYIGYAPLVGHAMPSRGPGSGQHLAGQPDATPQVILDAEWGVLTTGRTAAQADIAADIYHRTIQVILRSLELGGYHGFQVEQVLRAEPAQQDLLKGKTGEKSNLYNGEVALVTGGASGIGKACVESLLARGAAVVTMDINPAVTTQYDRPDFLGLQCDLAQEAAVIQAFELMVKRFGGLDMLVLNAGIFPAGIRIESLDMANWQKVMRINLDSNLVIMREAYPLLKNSPRAGRVLVNASKNVLAPGAGAAAYSASKAAVTQLARVAALEWGKDHIRINMIHPDAIFDTGIWTEEVLKARAEHYHMTVQEYKTRNVLGVELNSHYVGELVAEMLGPLFEKITGAQIPVDGGSDRVI